jgi:hypothetical protein
MARVQPWHDRRRAGRAAGRAVLRLVSGRTLSGRTGHGRRSARGAPAAAGSHLAAERRVGRLPVAAAADHPGGPGRRGPLKRRRRVSGHVPQPAGEPRDPGRVGHGRFRGGGGDPAVQQRRADPGSGVRLRYRRRVPDLCHQPGSPHDASGHARPERGDRRVDVLGVDIRHAVRG